MLIQKLQLRFEIPIIIPCIKEIPQDPILYQLLLKILQFNNYKLIDQDLDLDELIQWTLRQQVTPHLPSRKIEYLQDKNYNSFADTHLLDYLKVKEQDEISIYSYIANAIRTRKFSDKKLLSLKDYLKVLIDLKQRNKAIENKFYSGQQEIKIKDINLVRQVSQNFPLIKEVSPKNKKNNKSISRCDIRSQRSLNEKKKKKKTFGKDKKLKENKQKMIDSCNSTSNTLTNQSRLSTQHLQLYRSNSQLNLQ